MGYSAVAIADHVGHESICDTDFILTVAVSSKGEVSAEVIDPAFNEPYTLHLARNATGSFVGKVKAQYEEILSVIAENCFEPDVFKTNIAEQLIAHVREIYGDELEFLWNKFPYNAVWRRKDTRKWYGALLTVSKRKLGIKSDETAEIIDLRIAPEMPEALIDNKKYYAGYHMNKKHWYTIILDGTVSYEEICMRLRDSYLLANKK